MDDGGVVISTRGSVGAMTTETAASKLTEPSWLATWTLNDPVPVPAEAVTQSLTSFQNALIPATSEEVSVLLDQAIKLHGTPEGWEIQVGLYHRLLNDIPRDLLAEGMYLALRDGKWFPKPAEIREPIRSVLARRQLTAKRLDLALSRARRESRSQPTRRPSEEEKREVEAIIATLCARSPRHERPRESERMTGAERERVAAETKSFRLPGADDPGVKKWLRAMGEE
jgi:hypothetical protein